MLTELKNRVADVCIAVCDGLKGLPDAITTVWELTVVQPCIIHLLRNTFRFASRKYWDEIAHDLRPVYTAASEAEALARFAEFDQKWGKPYPAISRLWRNAWSEFVPFLDYDVEIRRIICSDDANPEPERPLPPSGPGQRSLPQRPGRDEMPLPGHPITGPHRQGQGTMGDEVEARPERVRHHLRGPDQPRPETDHETRSDPPFI